MKTKKAQIAALQPLILALVGISIVLVIGFLIMAEVKVQVAQTDGVFAENCTDTVDGGYSNMTSLACNGTSSVVDAMADIPGWLPIIVITVIGALLLGLVAIFRGGS